MPGTERHVQKPRGQKDILGAVRGLGLLNYKVQNGDRVGTLLGDVAGEVAGARLCLHSLVHSSIHRISIEHQKIPSTVRGTTDIAVNETQSLTYVAEGDRQETSRQVNERLSERCEGGEGP